MKINHEYLLQALWTNWTNCTSQCTRSRRKICEENEQCQGGVKILNEACDNDKTICFQKVDDHLNGKFFLLISQLHVYMIKYECFKKTN